MVAKQRRWCRNQFGLDEATESNKYTIDALAVCKSRDVPDTYRTMSSIMPSCMPQPVPCRLQKANLGLLSAGAFQMLSKMSYACRCIAIKSTPGVIGRILVACMQCKLPFCCNTCGLIPRVPLAQRNFVLTSSVLAWLLKFVELSRVCNITGVKQPLREASSHCHQRDSCFAAFLATSQKTESAKLVELNWL